MVTEASDQGTVYVIKAPERDIRSVAGKVPVKVSHNLFEHRLAPVIRTVIKIYDQPGRPLSLESFINVDEADQWHDFAQLAEQDEFLLLFYNENLSHRLTKSVRNTAGEQMSQILNWADRARASIPDERYDFDQAKRDVMSSTRL